MNESLKHLILSSLLCSLSGLFAQSTGGLSVVAGNNINVSQNNSNQFSVSIGVDPTDAQNVFYISDDDVNATGLLVGVSTDGGQTFATRIIADGNDALNVGSDTAQCVFDSFGNLIVVYREFVNPQSNIHVILSVDGGANFAQHQTIGQAGISNPTIATLNNNTWLAYRDADAGGVVARFLVSTALNTVGQFGNAELLADSAAGDFPAIGIGAQNQVAVAYQSPGDDEGPSTIFSHADADGTGTGTFGAAVNVSTTQVGGTQTIASQGNGTISASVGLAFDRTTGPNGGNLYLVYVDEENGNPTSTDVLLRVSTDSGATWGSSVQISDVTTNSQFLPRIATESTTGVIVVTWMDARNDAGDGQAGDTTLIANDNAEFVISASADGGQSFLPAVIVSQDTSDVGAATSVEGMGQYTGLALLNENAFTIRPDNTGVLGNNPNLPNLDLAFTPVEVILLLAPLQIDTPAQQKGSISFDATLFLTKAAPVGGATVALSGSGVTVASAVVVNAGEFSATFQVDSLVVPLDTNVSISATFNGITLEREFVLLSPTFETLELNPATISGNQSIIGTVTVDVAAGPEGLIFTLESSTPDLVSPPATVTITNGNVSADFTVSVKGVLELTETTISATFIDQTKTAELTLEVGRTDTAGSTGSCFVATAAYGSWLHPRLESFRAFRDESLRVSSIGENFVRTYYANSPSPAKWLRGSRLLRGLARRCLQALADVTAVAGLSESGVRVLESETPATIADERQP
jgi:hypothetical protein